MVHFPVWLLFNIITVYDFKGLFGLENLFVFLFALFKDFSYLRSKENVTGNIALFDAINAP